MKNATKDKLMRTQVQYQVRQIKNKFVLDFVYGNVVPFFDQVQGNTKQNVLAKFKKALTKNKITFGNNVKEVA